MNISQIKAIIKIFCKEHKTLEFRQKKEDENSFGIHLMDKNYEISIDIAHREGFSDSYMFKHSFCVNAKVLDPLPGDSFEAKRLYFNQIIDQITLNRSGLLDCQLGSRNNDLEIEIVHPLYTDGFNHHTFLATLYEILKARQQLELSIESWDKQAKEIKRLENEMQKTLESPPQEENQS
jgi:hypothetical protein